MRKTNIALGLKSPAKVFYDIISISAAYLLAFFLRFEFSFNPQEIPYFYQCFILLLIVQTFSHLAFGLYRGIWRYSSIQDLINIIKSNFAGISIFTAILFIFTRLEGFPRSVLLLYLALSIIFMGGGRLFWRILREYSLKRQYRSEKQKIVIIGAGAAGEQIAREIVKNPALKLRVIGFVDDDPQKQHKTLLGIPIIGQVKDLPAIVQKTDVKHAYIAIASATGAQVRRIVDTCIETELEFKILPPLGHDLNIEIRLSQLRKITPEDLLGREAVKLDVQSLGAMIENKTIMITGAGGSIGSELCRQIARFRPKKMVLFELTELFLFDLDNDLKKSFPKVEVIPVIGDVRNEQKVENILASYRPQLLFHAAAYKHVPMMEHNPIEAIRTNVLGTKIVASLANKYQVEKFVMISTDKAVNPTSIMGTSKRVAEMICADCQKQTSSTQYINVRFGNVLGSSGSVIPIFRRQIENGGPVTVTHPDIQRYFMSIPEASQLVIQAAELGKGGEIFVLDMGTPVKIVDLAKDMINLAGFKLGADIKIEFVGLRPGEKMFEELFADKENILSTNHPKVKIARVRPLEDFFDQKLHQLLELSDNTSKDLIKGKLKEIVPEFAY